MNTQLSIGIFNFFLLLQYDIDFEQISIVKHIVHSTEKSRYLYYIINRIVNFMHKFHVFNLHQDFVINHTVSYTYINTIFS